ncbi:MAG: hypothetical protein KGH53_00270 [Candidatus Micrarchaeota archaeon]|nr:hypothetical protein [Candidatus Micrarchaeota archaeon]
MAEGQLTTTGIDALVEYLNAHGETEEGKLAAELQVSEKVIEDWSSVLEKANVVKISYKVGKMFVSPLDTTKVDILTYKSSLDAKKQSVETELVAEINVLQEMERRIANISKIVSGADDSFKKNAGQLKRDLDELERIQKESERHYNGIKLEKDRIDKISETLGTEMKALEEIAGRIQSFSAGEGDVKSVISDVREKIKKYDNLTAEFNKGYDQLVRQKREEIVRIQDETKREMRQLEEALERQLKQLGENERLAKYAKHESARLKDEAERDRTMIVNNLDKAKQGVNAALPLAEKKMGDISNKVIELRKNFGELSNLNDNLGALREQLAKVRGEQQELFKQAQGIRGEIRELEYARKSDIEKTSEVQKLSKKVSELKAKGVELEGSVKEVKGNVDALAGEGPQV